MVVTIARILEIPIVKLAHPEILAGEHMLSRPVRWLHTPDLLDLRGYLKGDELILSSGTGFTQSVAAAEEYFASLSANGAAGLIVSFVGVDPSRRRILQEAAPNAPLPIILLDELRFVELTEIVHRILLTDGGPEPDHGRAVLRLARELADEGVTLHDILERSSRALLTPIIYEDHDHLVIAHASAGVSDALLLNDWTGRSARQATAPVTAGPAEDDWISSPVGSPSGSMGRLVIPLRPLSPVADEVLELTRDAIQRHFARPGAPSASARPASGAFEYLRNVHIRDETTATIRAQASGLPLSQRFLPLAVRVGGLAADDASATAPLPGDVVGVLQRSACTSGAHALCGVIDQSTVGMLLSAPDSQDLRAVATGILDAAAQRWRRTPWWAFAGTASSSLRETVTQGIDAAHEVARLTLQLQLQPGLHELSSPAVLLRRMLWELRDQEPLRGFTAQVLDGLKSADPELLTFTRKYIELNGNVAELSRILFLSRPSVYARVRRVEQLLQRSLGDAEVRMSLHLALAADAVG